MRDSQVTDNINNRLDSSQSVSYLLLVLLSHFIVAPGHMHLLHWAEMPWYSKLIIWNCTLEASSRLIMFKTGISPEIIQVIFLHQQHLHWLNTSKITRWWIDLIGCWFLNEISVKALFKTQRKAQLEVIKSLLEFNSREKQYDMLTVLLKKMMEVRCLRRSDCYTLTGGLMGPLIGRALGSETWQSELKSRSWLAPVVRLSSYL